MDVVTSPFLMHALDICWSCIRRGIWSPYTVGFFPRFLSFWYDWVDFRFVKANQESKMPLVFLEQLPLPSLRSYVTASVLLFVSAILYALNVTVGSGESDVPRLYDFMSQDNFCFWVSWTMLFEVPFLLILGHSSHICPSILVSLVELEHGLLWFVFVWENYPASCVWRSSRQWTSGEYRRSTRRFRFIKRASAWPKLVSFVALS